MTFDAPRFIRDVFQPESFAILGASDNPTRIGGRPLAYTRERFTGPIYPVNPTRDTVQGMPAFASISDIPGSVDFVLISVPAVRVEQAVRDCAAKGVRCCLIFSSGFAEVGDTAAQARLLEIAQPTGMRILGPNCLGLFDASHGFYPTFTATLDRGLPEGGHVSVVSQSGAYGSHIFYLNQQRGMGVGRMLTTGNECDVSVADGIHALAHDDATGCILAYAEGIKNGPAFRAALEAARQNRKPVAIMKVGRSDVGAAAAASHTASLAGEDAVFDAVLRQHGAFRARTTEELIDISVATRRRIYPVGRRLGIVTISGGAGVLMADAASDYSMDVAPMPLAAQKALKVALPFANPVNPVDVTAQVFNDLPLIRTNMDLMLGQGGYDSIVAFFTSLAGSPSLSGPLRDALSGSLENHPDSLIALSIIAPPDVVADYENAGFAAFEDPSRAVAAMAALSDFGAAFARPSMDMDTATTQTALPHGSMTEHEAKVLLAKAGVPVLPEELASGPVQAVEMATSMGYPVVLKIVSPVITHKTEIGGVALNLQNAEAVEDAAKGILARAVAAHPDAVIDGLLVAPMAPSGLEMILGVQRDPVFGPVVMCGLGGIFVEVLRDMTFRAAPFDLDEATRMINELKGQVVLDGVRGRSGGDRVALAQALVALSQFAVAHAVNLETCDINPFVLHKSGGVALDAVIVSTD